MSFLANLPTRQKAVKGQVSPGEELLKKGPRRYVPTENTDPSPENVIKQDPFHPFIRHLLSQPENQPDWASHKNPAHPTDLYPTQNTQNTQSPNVDPMDEDTPPPNTSKTPSSNSNTKPLTRKERDEASEKDLKKIKVDK